VGGITDVEQPFVADGDLVIGVRFGARRDVSAPTVILVVPIDGNVGGEIPSDACGCVELALVGVIVSVSDAHIRVRVLLRSLGDDLNHAAGGIASEQGSLRAFQYIEQTSPTTFTVTQGMSSAVQSVFAGIYPVTLTEFRAFLDFPLTGPAGIPSNAIIESAFLDVRIDNLQPTSGTIPILIELVSFQPPMLIETDFDRTLQPPLAFVRVAPPFSQADVGTNVSIDVTSLLVQAQQLQLPDFQVRIMEDLGPAIPVLIEIDDTTGANRASQAPMLTVTYF